jgi:hypothetical protein
LTAQFDEQRYADAAPVGADLGQEIDAQQHRHDHQPDQHDGNVDLDDFR